MEKQVDNHKLSFPITFEKIEEVDNQDTRFTKVKCWLMHTGKNYNQSEFTREVIENAIPTLGYIPIVGFLEEDELGEKDFSNHRYIITKDNGEIKRVYKGSAYGVVLSSEDNNAHFETKICSDGIEREFIVASGVMWNFLEDSSKVMNRDLIKDHSIELDENSIEGYEDEETGIFHFTKFSFRAACVLGGGCLPAMEGSTVEVVQFSMSDFVRNIQSELNDKYSEFVKIANDTTFTKTVNENINQGGMMNMSSTDFTAQFENISAMVRQHEVFTSKLGEECSRFEVVDICENEVIVVDKVDGYNCFGLSFAVITGDDGDKTEIDFENVKKKKICYENYAEGDTVFERAFNFGKHIGEVEDTYFAKVEEANAKVSEYKTKVSEIEENYNQIKADFDEMKPKYDDYVKAEQARIDAELDAQKDAEFAKYESVLADNVDFVALKEKKVDMTIKEIESECAILYARKNLAQTNFSKSNDGTMTAGLIDDAGKDGFVETKYGYIPVNR